MITRLLWAGLVAFLVAHTADAALASTVTYDLTLKNSNGSAIGGGSFILNGSISGGTDNFTSNGGGLTSLSIDINGDPQAFTLSDALTTADVTFQNGNLTNISYLGEMNGFKLDLATTGLFYLYIDANDWSLSSSGTISAVDPPSVAPLPATSVLFATGLLGFGFLLYRRRSALHRSGARATAV